MTENKKGGFEQFNVFETEYTDTIYHGARNQIRVVNQTPDGRHATFAGQLPNGVTFTEHPANVEETFYIVRGTIKCTLENGETIEWREGDLVYWPYTEKMELEYSPGLLCICFFWSDEPLPNFLGDDAAVGSD
jgi:quercetin dioxygenase-like cupin family protein